jgi:hypothetical protein
MTGAIFVPWKNPLAEVMRKPGGVKIGQALAAAAENLEKIRESCLQAVDAHLSELERLCGEAHGAEDDQVRMAIYHASNDICGVAGVFGLPELGEAAISLCELVDRLRALGRWNADAVEVHLSALRLLRRPAPGEDRSDVVRGLRKLVDRVASIS